VFLNKGGGCTESEQKREAGRKKKKRLTKHKKKKPKKPTTNDSIGPSAIFIGLKGNPGNKKRRGGQAGRRGTQKTGHKLLRDGGQISAHA